MSREWVWRGLGGCPLLLAREYVFLTLINAMWLEVNGEGAGCVSSEDGLRTGRGWLRAGSRVRVFNHFLCLRDGEESGLWTGRGKGGNGEDEKRLPTHVDNLSKINT